MKTLGSRMTTLTGLVLISSFIAPAAALADSVNLDITSISYKKIIVESDGYSYTKADAGALTIRAHLEMDAGFSGRVKRWKVWPTLQGLGFKAPSLSYSQYAVQKNYPTLERPKRVDRQLILVLPGADISTAAKSYCNNIRQNYMQGGKSAAWVLSADRTYTLEVDMDMSYDISGISGTQFQAAETDKSRRQILVTCQKYTPKSGSDAVAAVPGTSPEVTHISNNISAESALDGSYCRVRINGVFTSNKTNMPLKYRYGYSDMNPATPDRFSQVKSVTTSHAKTAMTTDIYNVPVVAGPERGRVWIETVEPNVEKSVVRDFEMNCAKQLSVQAEKPIQKTVKFEASQKQRYGNMMCPTAGHIVVVLKGSGTAFEGQGRITVKNEKGEQHSSGMQDISLSAHGVTFFGMPYNLKWTSGPTFAAPGAGGALTKSQKLSYRLALVREGEVNNNLPAEQTLDIDCAMVLADQAPQPATTSLQGNSGGTAPAAAVMVSPALMMPDLQIMKVEQLDSQRLKVLLSNKGKGASGASAVSLSADKTNNDLKPLAALKAGESRWVTLRLPKAADQASLEVDPKNQVKEQNEKNNQRKFVFK